MPETLPQNFNILFLILNNIMDFYLLFRILRTEWNTQNKRENLGVNCQNSNYPKNIIVYAGGQHINSIHMIINLIQLNLKDFSVHNYREHQGYLGLSEGFVGQKKHNILTIDV